MVIAQCAVWIYFSDNAYLPPNRDAPRTEMLYWAFFHYAITFLVGDLVLLSRASHAS